MKRYGLPKQPTYPFTLAYSIATCLLLHGIMCKQLCRLDICSCLQLTFVEKQGGFFGVKDDMKLSVLVFRLRTRFGLYPLQLLSKCSSCFVL